MSGSAKVSKEKSIEFPAIIYICNKENKPLIGVPVWLGLHHAYTDAKGEALFLGITPGEYDLQIDESDSRPVRKRLTLNPDIRRHEVILQSFATGIIKGYVRLDRTESPITGAEVKLSAVNPDETGTQELSFWTDWDGYYEGKYVPIGEYNYLVEAERCAPQQGSVQIENDGILALNISLSPLPDPVKVKVYVRTEDGSQVKKSKVRLLEGMDAITVAEKEGSDICIFEELDGGPFNDVLLKESPFISRNFVVSADIEGYHTGYAAGNLRHKKECEVTVVCNKAYNEEVLIRKNGNLDAVDFPLNETLKVEISGDKKERIVKVKLPHAGNVIVTAGPNQYNTFLRVLDKDLKLLAESWCYGGGIAQRSVQAGAVELMIGVSGQLPDAPDIFSLLNINYQPIIDPFEPNDTFETGSPIEFGEIIRPFIFPQKDANYFAIEVKSHGILRARLSESNINTALAILNPDGKVLTSNWAYGGGSIDISSQIYSKGLYRISVTSTDPNSSSLKASRLRVDLIRTETLLEDFAAEIAKPKPIPFAKAIGGTIFPAGKRICYQISPDRSGFIRFRFQLAECNSSITIKDDNGKQLYSSWAYGTGFLAADIAIPQPGDYFIELSGTDPSQISLRSLFFRVYFYPNDEYEGHRENSIPETAAEISIRQDVAGVIARPGDIDYYRFYIDQPGLVTLYTGAFPLDLSFIVYGIDGNEVFNSWGYRNSVWNREFHVREKGYYLLKVQSTNGNAYSSSSYRFRLEIARIKPESTMEEGHLILNLNTGMKIDVLIPGSKKVLIIPVPKPATVTIGVKNPIDASMAITDSSGKELWSGWGYGGGVLQRTIKIESPTTLRAVLQGTNVNAWSKDHYFIYATEGRVPPEPAITCEQIMEDNRTVAFSVPGAARYEMDFEGNGRFKEIEPGLIQHKYEEGRIYAPKLRITDESGAVSTESIYIDLQDIKLKGLSCRIVFPQDGDVVASPRAVFVQALKGPGGTVTEMKLYLDDKLIARSDSASIESEISWKALSPGEHTIWAEAYAADGERAQETSRFQMSGVFDLWPEGGRTITGSRAVITWFSPQRNETLVEYRKFDVEKWDRAIGQSGKQHRIVLEGLEFGAPYEFRAGDGKSWSDVRILTLQKGLSFEQPRYGASIPREYGQSMPVTVRNSSDKPQEVVLECMPPAGGELLVGFVGEGSEDRPVQLAPGEIRQFMLALSAQDCVSELHRFSVHIRSKSGYSDQAEVEVRVKIPKVDLQWEELETNPNTLGKKLRLINKGDSLTDLTIRVEPAEGFRLRPAVEHVIFQANSSIELWADPILHENFKELIGEAKIEIFGKTTSHTLTCALPDHMNVFKVDIDPTFIESISSWYCTNRPEISLLAKILDLLFAETEKPDNNILIDENIIEPGVAGDTYRPEHPLVTRKRVIESSPYLLSHISFELFDAPEALNAGERVKLWLKKHLPMIIGAEVEFKVDRRAIASAIAYEALVNINSLNRSLRACGPGKVHYWDFPTCGKCVAEEVEDAGYLLHLDQTQRKETVKTAKGAIIYIAAIMRAQADVASGAGYNLNCDVPMLTTFYNAWKLIELKDHFAKKKYPEPLTPNDEMGRWASLHIEYIEDAVGKPSPSIY